MKEQSLKRLSKPPIEERAAQRITMIIEEDEKKTFTQTIINSSLETIFEGNIVDFIKILKELSNCISEYWKYMFNVISSISRQSDDPEMSTFNIYSSLKGMFINDLLFAIINDPIKHLITPYGKSMDKFTEFVLSLSSMFNDDINRAEELINLAIEKQYEGFTQDEFVKLGSYIDKFVSIHGKI